MAAESVFPVLSTGAGYGIVVGLGETCMQCQSPYVLIEMQVVLLHF